MSRKIKLQQDFKYHRLIKLTAEGLKSYNDLANRFKGNYNNPHYYLTDLALRLADKLTRERRLVAGDDPELLLIK